MLDAYIIDRIRREREQPRDGGFIPLHIEPPPPPSPRDERETDRRDEDTDHGSVVIDFGV